MELTFTFPNRLDIADATITDAAEMMLVVKNIEPRRPSSMP